MLYFKAMSNSIDFYKWIFFHVIPVRIIVPWPIKTCMAKSLNCKTLILYDGNNNYNDKNNSSDNNNNNNNGDNNNIL